MPLRLLLLFILLLSVPGASFAQQNVGYKYGIDTAFHQSKECPDSSLNFLYPYWHVKGKYPLASATIRARAEAELVAKSYAGRESGFVIFQTVRDCAGQPAMWKLLLYDEHYEPATFSQALVQGLYGYVQSLKSWPPGVLKGVPVYYRSYLTFKIENGHVAQVSP